MLPSSKSTTCSLRTVPADRRPEADLIPGKVPFADFGHADRR
jgi:hypothetical protein